MTPYTKLATVYDAIYASMGKDYAGEAQTLHALIRQHKTSPGSTLLDVACGTGGHIEHLRTWYEVQGLDLSAAMIEVARRRLPPIPYIPFHVANMADFVLGRQFSAITCLFSAIGYVKTLDKLHGAVYNMACHLEPGGVLIVEPWFTPGTYRAGSLHATFVDRPDLKIARMCISEKRDRVAMMEMHYLVTTAQGVEYFTDLHEMGLFTHDEYVDAVRSSGLGLVYEPEGLTGRGLYVGIKSLASTE